MYDFGPDYRSILGCTLDTHIADFEDVVAYVRAVARASGATAEARQFSLTIAFVCLLTRYCAARRCLV